MGYTSVVDAFQGFGSNENETITTGLGARPVRSAATGEPVTSIPIIDFTDANSPSLEARRRVAKEIYDACTKIGFFYVKSHDVDESLIEKCQEDAHRFFGGLSDEEKSEYSMSKNTTEYYGYALMKTTMPDGAIKRRKLRS